VEHSDIPGDKFQVRRYFPAYFIIVFSFLDDMLWVLHDPTVGDPLLPQICLQEMAATASRQCRGPSLLRLPARICNPSAASQILGLGCANLVAVSPMATSNNLSSMTVKAWCIHLDPIPRGKVIFVSGLELVHVRGPSLFLDPGEIIHHSRPTLRYRVLINILEVEDSDSSSDAVMRTVAEADRLGSMNNGG
jgi:hypothetical protein